MGLHLEDDPPPLWKWLLLWETVSPTMIQWAGGSREKGWEHYVFNVSRPPGTPVDLKPYNLPPQQPRWGRGGTPTPPLGAPSTARGGEEPGHLDRECPQRGAGRGGAGWVNLCLENQESPEVVQLCTGKHPLMARNSTRQWGGERGPHRYRRQHHRSVPFPNGAGSASGGRPHVKERGRKEIGAPDVGSIILSWGPTGEQLKRIGVGEVLPAPVVLGDNNTDYFLKSSVQPQEGPRGVSTWEGGATQPKQPQPSLALL